MEKLYSENLSSLPLQSKSLSRLSNTSSTSSLSYFALPDGLPITKSHSFPKKKRPLPCLIGISFIDVPVFLKYKDKYVFAIRYGNSSISTPSIFSIATPFPTAPAKNPPLPHSKSSTFQFCFISPKRSNINAITQGSVKYWLNSLPCKDL